MSSNKNQSSFTTNEKPTRKIESSCEITGSPDSNEAQTSFEQVQLTDAIDKINIGVMVISPKMEILATNAQIRKWFPEIQVSKRPVCFKTIHNPPRTSLCPSCATYEAFQDGKVHESVTKSRKNINLPYFRVVSCPIKDRTGRIVKVVQIAEDITDRSILEQELKSRYQTLDKLVKERADELIRSEERSRALNFFAGKVNAAKNLDEVYEWTLDAMEKTLGFAHAAFLTISQNKLCRDHQRGYRAPLDFEIPLDGSRRGVTVKAANSGKTLLIPDVSKEKDYVQGGPGSPPARSELAVPVVAEGEAIGVLNVESTELNGFNEQDAMLMEILASHAATAITNIKHRDELVRRAAQQALLLKCSAEIIHSFNLRQRLQTILDAVRGLGWGRVVISLINENFEITRPEDIVASGLSEEERLYLWNHRKAGNVWKERLGPEFQRFKLGDFYYLPWSDSFVRKKFSRGVILSHLSPEQMIDWNPDDLLYAPLTLADGRVVGIMSIDDPVDGRKPTKESLAAFELFLYQAAVAIENARLIEQLSHANSEIQEYAEHLELKVEKRTAELVEAQNKLLRAQRLAAIGELAGMVGHDLRNPLTGIAGATYYLKKKLSAASGIKEKEMFETIEKSIGYSNKIINDLLDYSREIRLELSITEPNCLLKEALSLLEIPQRIQIQDKTEKTPSLRVDKEKILRVFTNIIKNAFDAIPDTGILVVESRAQNDNVVFSFSDTGTGISDDVMKKLWVPLFTTKAKGMGFGLPICKRIIEAHGGKIEVQSGRDKGSTFTVTLPIDQTSAANNEKNRSKCTYALQEATDTTLPRNT
jgi:signal transduction histidine kinase/putative methionine-R-sulfoxide reductase with GAF domain